MNLSVLVEQYGVQVGAALGIAVLLWFSLRPLLRWRRRAAVPPPYEGPGAALAFALDGDLSGARRVLEASVRAGTARGRADAARGLVAVLRAQGEIERAAAVVNALARWGGGSAVKALQVRMALDAGRPDRAAAVVAEAEPLGVPLEVAALCRADRWPDALRRYHERVPRKMRDREMLAALLAGNAAWRARHGGARAARRLIKRSVALSANGFLPALVGVLLHPKEAERRRLAAALVHRVPALAGRGGALEGMGHLARTGDDTDALLARARSRRADGEPEAALAMLREHLDAHAEAWRVRNQYCVWVLEEGEPADWHAELTEVLSVLERAGILDEAGGQVGPVHCRSCGFDAEVPFYICPRCDAIGSLVGGVEVSGPKAAGGPSHVGARLSDLLGGVPPEDPEARG